MSICLTTAVESPFPPDDAPSTLVDLLEYWSVRRGTDWAYRFMGDGAEVSLSFADLNAKARQIAAALAQCTVPGDRVLLVYPAGLDFICGFFGCLYAGVLPVPATYPKPRRPMPRLSAIVADCGATAALTTASTLANLDLARVAQDLSQLTWISTDALPICDSSSLRQHAAAADDLAFLQYTSGSTSEPKGVMVTHANLMNNLETIRLGFGIERGQFGDVGNVGVFWLPAYHDMGLIGGILMPLYVGGRSVLMSPTAFLQRPRRWLKAISEYGAKVSGAPNFAYDLCVRKVTPEQRATLDLSHWQLAFCGAEPIRPETLEAFRSTFAPCGFRADAFYPCYGLAESTLLASGPAGADVPTVKTVKRSSLADHRVEDALPGDADAIGLVGCGLPHGGQEILIVDPDSRCKTPPEEVGEIWVRGPSVARGYWNRPADTAEVFQAWPADGDDGPFLRTGDLGFFCDGHLYVTGRAKDVIIIRGRNHYPQDLEYSVERAHDSLRPGAGAAFAVEVGDQERLVLVHEIDRGTPDDELNEVMGRIRWTVSEDHEVDLHAIVLIRQASLPMTTSGKVQRSLCREQFLTGELRELGRWMNPAANGRPSVAVAPLSAFDDANSPLPVAGRVNGHANGNVAHSLVGESATGAKRTTIVPTADEIDRKAERIEAWVIDWLVERAGIPRQEMDRHKPFAEFGLDSLTAVELSQELEDFLKIQINPVIAWSYPTIAALAGFLAREVSGGNTPSVDSSATSEGVTADASPADFNQLLAEIESLSDAEALSELTGGKEQH